MGHRLGAPSRRDQGGGIRLLDDGGAVDALAGRDAGAKRGYYPPGYGNLGIEVYVLRNMRFMLDVARDIEEYEHFFFEKLSHLAEIQEIHSNIVLSEIKYTTQLPI